MYVDTHARSVVCDLDVCTVLGRRIQGITRVLQAHDMGNNDESLPKDSGVVTKNERRKGIASDHLDAVVRMKATS